MDWAYPLIAILFAWMAKGCYRQINIILVCLLTFIYGYEEHIIANGIIDSHWQDAIMICLYGLAAHMFHIAGGHIQSNLAYTGMFLHLTYFSGWLMQDYDPRDFYYTEIFVALTILQLIAASKGGFWSVLNNKLHGAPDGISRSSAHGASSGSIHNKHP